LKKIQRALKFFIYFVAVVGILSGCDNKSQSQTDAEAVGLINQYLQFQQDGDIETAIAMFPAEVQDKQRALLQSFVAKRGDIQSFAIEAIEPNTVYSGKYYLAIVHVVGSRQEATEMITVLNKLSDNRSYVVSHASK